jgi:hypothetical protein
MPTGQSGRYGKSMIARVFCLLIQRIYAFIFMRQAFMQKCRLLLRLQSD